MQSLRHLDHLITHTFGLLKDVVAMNDISSKHWNCSIAGYQELQQIPLTVSLEQLSPSVLTMYRSAFCGSFLFEKSIEVSNCRSYILEDAACKNCL